MLYLVSTPIGNLEDITFRAVKILSESNYILVEDSRRARILLKRYSIDKKLVVYNDINKEKKARSIIEDLKQGFQISLITDAGTPGISDPGFYITRACRENNIEVFSIPGPNAAISALIVSGFPTDRFTFYGFLPKTEGKIRKVLGEIDKREETAVIYESTHRIKKTLERIDKFFPEFSIFIAREMTKKFEEHLFGTAKEILQKNKDRNIKGEIVLVIKPKQ